MAKITNRFRNLLAQVEAETGQRPTYEEIYNETGVAMSTLSAYARGTITRYDESTLTALCDFFVKRLKKDFDISDLLEYPPANGQDMQPKAQMVAMPT